MKTKPVVPREVASRDVDEAIEHYLNDDAQVAALGFAVLRVLRGQRDIPASLRMT